MFFLSLKFKKLCFSSLIQPEVLQEMVDLVVTEPASDLDMKSRFKYANLAAEVLTCGDVTIIDKLTGTPDLFNSLYK